MWALRSTEGSNPSLSVLRRALLVLGLAAASLLLVAPAPSYDPLMWLLWGRELTEGSLSTAEGPAFKPLPVAVAALLAPLGDAAPWLWVLIARAGGVAALALAWRLAGPLAAVAVLVTGGFASYAASGLSEGLLLGCALGAVAAGVNGRPRLALALALACGLLRVEAWPFLALAAVWAWWHRPQDRALYLAAGVALPAAWFLPELAGSGDLLRSGDRARIPNPGQPAEAAFPAWESLRQAAPLLPPVLWLGLLGARRCWWPAALGAAWVLLVALMAQAGFSGEPRYALPGVCLIAISAAAGWAAIATSWVPNPAQRGALLAVLAAAVVIPEAGRVAGVRAEQAHQQELQSDLRDAIAAAGGRDAILACGTPYVGPYRGPLMAYRLHVRKEQVEPDDPPRAPGTVFQSRGAEGAPLEPASDLAVVATAGEWTVRQQC